MTNQSDETNKSKKTDQSEKDIGDFKHNSSNIEKTRKEKIALTLRANLLRRKQLKNK